MSLWDDLDAAEMTDKKEFTRITDGTYTAVISDVEIKEDIFQVSVSVEFTIDEGEFKNRKVWHNSLINDDIKEKRPEVLGYMKMAICKMAGVDTTEGKPMEVLAGVKGNRCEIFIKNNASKKDPSKVYTNVFVNGKID